MIALLSPAKRLNESPHPDGLSRTDPPMLNETAALLQILREKSADDLAELMHLSDKLAQLNVDRYAAMVIPHPVTATKAAGLLYDGEAYRGLDAPSFDAEDWAFAQQHLRLLSGLYGVLRPLDAIAPHRLEMGTSLKNARGDDLYAFWGDRIARRLNDALQGHAERTIVNVASKEYFTAVDRDTLDARVVTCHFKEWRDGKAKIITVYAKQARGMMARFIIKNRLTDAASLKFFDFEGYAYDPQLSSADDWVFVRDPQ